MNLAIDFDLFENNEVRTPSVSKKHGQFTYGSEPLDCGEFSGEKPWIETLSGMLIEGVYVNMPEADYHKIEAVSSSFLKTFALNPHEAEAKFKGESTSEITPQLKRSFDGGKLAHAMLLEPHKIESDFVQIPLPEDLRDSGKIVLETHDALKEYLAQNNLTKGTTIAQRVSIATEFNEHVVYYPSFQSQFNDEEKGKAIIDIEDWKRIEEVTEKIKQSPLGRSSLDLSEGYCELTLVAYDPVEELWVKARLDRVTGRNMLLDVKTIHTLSAPQIMRDLEDRLYSIQGSFYHYVAELVGFEMESDCFALLFLEWLNHPRFQLVELSDESWLQSRRYMLEIYADAAHWLKQSKLVKNGLNYSTTLVVAPRFYNLQKRVRVNS